MGPSCPKNIMTLAQLETPKKEKGRMGVRDWKIWFFSVVDKKKSIANEISSLIGDHAFSMIASFEQF